MTREQILQQIMTLRRAQGLQPTVPASRFLADLVADMLAQDMRKEDAA
jgi:hypothetical protein